MTRPTDRRRLLMTVGAAALVAAAGTGLAQSMDVHGTIMFKGGTAIPAGHLSIYLEDLAIQNSAQRRVAEARVQSDGGSKAIDFSLAGPAGTTDATGLQIVARLERADGWLLARGSAQFAAGGAVTVTLNEAVY
jgi:uncharacterized lipoprotein YbaY